ncbi:hypothetical protein [Argonema antarcticum]|uniref:hypothetical protein n=1 Tax=Argonema antarcticum TaxID=2942763 RepID=UPI002010EB29|nr:hypothetical protein [Argonema antarcticum]MCL1471146.1 hypothetical protein [Argonema antarcticum A004/B2]
MKSPYMERATEMIKNAIGKKIALLEHSRQHTRKNLEKFENKYNITSEKFIDEWAAEDLEGKDMEYVEWAGEYHCLISIDEDLKVLNSLEYVVT